MADYNREKTLAVVTGIVCALIFLAGTALGSIHAIKLIGALGVLAVACYVIADIAVAWAAYIDYQEDGNAMEWTAWIVKYVLSAYLLFTGGCIAYVLFTSGETQASRTATSTRASDAQKQCLESAKQANGGKLPRTATAECRKVYEAQLSAESSGDNKKEEARVKQSGWVDDFVAWPLFNYLPGILGLIGLFFLTLVSKLSKNSQGQSGHSPGQSGYSQAGQSGHYQGQSPLPATASASFGGGRSRRAPFTVNPGLSNNGGLASVTNGNGFTFSFAQSGQGYNLRFRERGSNAKHVVWLNSLDAEMLANLDYQALALEATKRREARHGQDGLYKQMAQSVA